MSEPIVDWRGTVITEGATVIYGGPVGRSIQMVEGRVVGFTKGGRVNVEIIRRAYSKPWAGDKKIVHVGADRLTIVGSLPPTDQPEWGPRVDVQRALDAERKARQDTHDIQGVEEMEEFADGRRWPHRVWKCTRCGRSSYDAGLEVCDGHG